MPALAFYPIEGLPMIQPGDDLATMIVERLAAQSVTFQDGDLLALAQKIVSKSEGQLVNLVEVEPTERAKEIAATLNKDPRFIEMVLRESREVIWVSPGIFIVETHHGFVCANAGIDHSNIGPVTAEKPVEEAVQEADWICLLPVDPDASARHLQGRVQELTGANIAVLINDTHGRPFRAGNMGVALGAAGLVTLFDQRGDTDLQGYTLQATLTATGDELAAATSLVMGQAAEAIPAVLVRGLHPRLLHPATDAGAQPLIRPADHDVFRYPKGRD